MPESFFPAPRKKTWQRRTARFSNRCALFIFLSHDYINYGMHNTTLTNKTLIFKLLKNSPNWSPYISRDNKLREFDQGSKHFSFGVHLINSCNLLSWSCVDIIWRKSMLVTLRLKSKWSKFSFSIATDHLDLLAQKKNNLESLEKPWGWGDRLYYQPLYGKRARASPKNCTCNENST